MSQSVTYTVQFYDHLNKSGIIIADLPESLQDLIKKFEIAKTLWDKADIETKSNLFNALLQSDAFISAKIEQDEKPTDEKIDKVKLMAFKARALKVKWKLSNPDD